MVRMHCNVPKVSDSVGFQFTYCTAYCQKANTKTPIEFHIKYYRQAPSSTYVTQ